MNIEKIIYIPNNTLSRGEVKSKTKDELLQCSSVWIYECIENFQNDFNMGVLNNGTIVFYP